MRSRAKEGQRKAVVKPEEKAVPTQSSEVARPEECNAQDVKQEQSKWMETTL
jgi:hypothetical protein